MLAKSALGCAPYAENNYLGVQVSGQPPCQGREPHEPGAVNNGGYKGSRLRAYDEEDRLGGGRS